MLASEYADLFRTGLISRQEFPPLAPLTVCKATIVVPSRLALTDTSSLIHTEPIIHNDTALSTKRKLYSKEDNTACVLQRYVVLHGTGLKSADHKASTGSLHTC